MRHEIHEPLKVAVKKVFMAEQTLFMFDNHARAWVKRGLVDLRDMFGPFKADIRSVIKVHRDEIGVLCRGTKEAVFVDAAKGLGSATLLLLGALPPLEDMHSVRACYKYCGLHCDEDGLGVRKRKNSFGGYSTKAQSVLLERIAGTIVKVGGPYRDVYDGRREYTATVVHPLMVDEGCPHCDESRGESARRRKESKQTRERQAVALDCSHFGGPHWTAGHQHKDAKRFVAKAVIKDLWNVVHGREPTYGRDFAFFEVIRVG